MLGRAARNGADGGIQDTTQHLHDRACTHESSHVQGVQECGWEGGASHSDARVCETRSLTRLCMPFEMRDVCLGEPMVGVHGSVERVPTAKGMGTEECGGACAQLERIAMCV